MLIRRFILSSGIEITEWENTAGINRINLLTESPKTELEAQLNLYQMMKNGGI
jgi:hypothetical protein